jgi:hypothetical protein
MSASPSGIFETNLLTRRHILGIFVSCYTYLLYICINYKSDYAPVIVHNTLDTVAYYVVDLPYHGMIPRPTLRLLGFLYGSIVVGALFAAPMIWLGFIFPDTSPKPTTRPAKKLAPSAVNLTLYEVHEIYDNESDAKSGSGKPLKRWVYEVDVVRKRSLLSES